MQKKHKFEIDSNFWSSFAMIFGIAFLILILVFGIGLLFPTNVPLVLTAALGGSVLFMTLPFYMGVRRMRVTTVPRQPFRGKKQTMKDLKAMNSKKYPFEIVETKKHDIVLRFKLVDDKWSDILGKGGLNKSYTLYLKLDPKKKTAYTVERTKTIDWSIDYVAGSARWGIECFQGIIMFDVGKIWELDLLHLFDGPTDIYYSVSETKWPVFRKLLEAGWTIKPRFFMRSVKKDKV